MHSRCIYGYFNGAAEILGVVVGRAEGVETVLDDSEFGVVVNEVLKCGCDAGGQVGAAGAMATPSA